MSKLQMVRKVTCVTTNKEQASDLDYWQSRSISERIDAIEMLRESYMSYQKNVPQRLQRVYRVASGRSKDTEELKHESVISLRYIA